MSKKSFIKVVPDVELLEKHSTEALVFLFSRDKRAKVSR